MSSIDNSVKVFVFKKVTLKAAVEYELKRVETGDGLDCDEAEVPKPLRLQACIFVCVCVSLCMCHLLHV